MRWGTKRAKGGPSRCDGSVLVGLLWCIALLAVIVIGVLHTVRIDLLLVKNHGDEIQAHYLALAGIEKAKALLYHDAAERRRSARNHTGTLFDDANEFRDVELGRGRFRVFRQGRHEENNGIIYGVSDEESRLNLNRASEEELNKLYSMTPDVLAAIMDWRDPDNAASPGGAEAEYYAALRPPRLPRNGPFQTVRELAMVRGMPRDLFAGEDANLNGLLDPSEDDGAETYPTDNADGFLDSGWFDDLTVHSSVREVNAAGERRVNLQSADESALTAIPGISGEIARAIVAYRGQRQYESLADLLDVTAGQPQAAPPTGAPPGQGVPEGVRAEQNPNPSGSAPAVPSGAPPTGPPVISEELLMEIADDVTVNGESALPGAINLNTASETVLGYLPGISRELARAVVGYRKSAGFFPNIAWLLKVDGMNRDIFKRVAPLVSARSETFRILSEGEVPSSGARKRLQVIVQLSATRVDTLAYREDDL